MVILVLLLLFLDEFIDWVLVFGRGLKDERLGEGRELLRFGDVSLVVLLELYDFEEVDLDLEFLWLGILYGVFVGIVVRFVLLCCGGGCKWCLLRGWGG